MFVVGSMCFAECVATGAGVVVPIICVGGVLLALGACVVVSLCCVGGTGLNCVC